MHIRSHRVLAVLLVLMLILAPANGKVAADTGIAAPSSSIRAQALTWYDGLIQYSTVTNCGSIIFGNPYQESGIGTYVGYLSDPDAGQPAVNSVYYSHVVIYGLGNPCSGTRAYVDFGPPANTSLAIDGAHPVYCFYDGNPLQPSECPQVLSASSYTPGMYAILSAGTANAGTWPVAQGHSFEFQVPLRSTQSLSSSQMSARIWAIDGNSSPWLQPQQGVYVFGGASTPAISIAYPNPSTTGISGANATSYATLYTYAAGGTAYFDIGADTGYTLFSDAVVIPANGQGWSVWDDWKDSGAVTRLQPDTLYHWRLRFASGGQTYYGVDQTFRTLPVGQVTVGDGQASSCTPAALSTALANGSTILFDCGPAPATITLNSTLAITKDITVDGGGLVTLSRGGAGRHFEVQASHHLTLSEIALVSGNSGASCGGAVYVAGGAWLTLNRARLENNATLTQGGAICVAATGQADISQSTFTGNTASSGGAIANFGTVTLSGSTLQTNSAGAHGGGVGNYGTLTATGNQFQGNHANVNGGAIDTTVSLAISGGIFSGNSAGFRGGAINNYLGTWTMTGASLTGNSAGAYGGAVANDAGTGTIDDSKIEGNTTPSLGGGIRNSGTLTLRGSTLAANTAGTNGGGLETSGSLTLTNSTLSGNHADAGNGGGLYWDGGTAALLNVTVADNVAAQGGNLYLTGAPAGAVSLKNTLVASGTPNDCDVAATSLGNNLESGNTCGLTAAGDLVNTGPGLGALADNGGPTQTRALLVGSPAIDGGSNSGCPATDQRQVQRPFDGNGDGTATCDIGAYESSSQAPPTPTPVSTPTSLPTATPTATPAPTSTPTSQTGRTFLPLLQ